MMENVETGADFVTVEEEEAALFTAPVALAAGATAVAAGAAAVAVVAYRRATKAAAAAEKTSSQLAFLRGQVADLEKSASRTAGKAERLEELREADLACLNILDRRLTEVEEALVAEEPAPEPEAAPAKKK